MRPTSPNPTGNALSGLKEEGCRLLEPPGEVATWPTRSHHACRPPLRFLAAVKRGEYGFSTTEGACRAWVEGGWDGVRRYWRMRPAVADESVSFFLRHLEVRP